jgi:hypothetical protein
MKKHGCYSPVSHFSDGIERLTFRDSVGHKSLELRTRTFPAVQEKFDRDLLPRGEGTVLDLALHHSYGWWQADCTGFALGRSRSFRPSNQISADSVASRVMGVASPVEARGISPRCRSTQAYREFPQKARDAAGRHHLDELDSATDSSAIFHAFGPDSEGLH